MFNFFKRKGKSKMPTAEDLKTMSLEEKKQLLDILKTDIESTADDTKADEKTEQEQEQVETEEGTKTDEELVGGKADGKTVEDIAKMHNVTVEVLQSELEKGIAVEMEHTGDPEKAKEIALDHLSEQADYYEKLKQVEQPNQTPQPSVETLMSEMEKRIEEKMQSIIDGLAKQLDDRDKTIKSMDSQIQEMRRVSPTQNASPILTQSSFLSPEEQGKTKTVNSWTKSPSTQYQSVK